jgi:hypothetical protein
MARGSLRVLLGYDRVVLPKLSLGGRVGVAFNGGPSRVDEPEFLPLHLEGRVSYWLFGTERRRARPFFYVAGGLAQVDLRKELVVHDCSTQATRRRFQDCLNAEGDFETLQSGLPEVHVTATRKLGRGFVSAGVAVFVPVFGSMGLVPAASAWLMFPQVGFVLQPSLGLMVGF